MRTDRKAKKEEKSGEKPRQDIQKAPGARGSTSLMTADMNPPGRLLLKEPNRLSNDFCVHFVSQIRQRAQADKLHQRAAAKLRQRFDYKHHQQRNGKRRPRRCECCAEKRWFRYSDGPWGMLYKITFESGAAGFSTRSMIGLIIKQSRPPPRPQPAAAATPRPSEKAIRPSVAQQTFQLWRQKRTHSPAPDKFTEHPLCTLCGSAQRVKFFGDIERIGQHIRGTELKYHFPSIRIPYRGIVGNMYRRILSLACYLCFIQAAVAGGKPSPEFANSGDCLPIGEPAEHLRPQVGRSKWTCLFWKIRFHH